jgi:NitT/TauT family transport system substrate-binding protein
MDRADLVSPRTITRRRFVTSASTLAAAGLFGVSGTSRSEAPLETTHLRLVKLPAICLAPEYLAEELLRLEGFSEIDYVDLEANTTHQLLLNHKADITVTVPPGVFADLDAGRPILLLAGLHGGCYELFANERVHAIRDLKGKRVAVSALTSTEYYFIAAMVAYVGMDPRKDIEWVDAKSYEKMMQYFVDGTVDAFLAFPPQPQYLRAQGIGHVIVNTAQDRPWEQYFCCMIAAHKEFVSKNPVATKRAVRAILKATDICAKEPERAARYIVAKGYEPKYEIALDVLRSLSYNRWRSYNPDDSLRFFGARLHEVGLIKTNPQKLIAQSTDWRFLNELKKELKA